MTAYFQYGDENIIVSKCRNGSQVVVYFLDGKPCDVAFAGGEWKADDDDLYVSAALVRDGSQPYQWVSLADLCRYAADEYPIIMAEAQREADNEARHEKSMSDSSRFI